MLGYENSVNESLHTMNSPAAPGSKYRLLSPHQDVGGSNQEFSCKICTGRKFKSNILFMSHLSSNHASAEGGSYTCRYGDNGICNACPAVGISQTDYRDHVTRHHINRDKQVHQQNQWSDSWHVLSSTVNLPAVLNDPGKGKQKDFFTRSWGADFADSSILPPSPHLCELPPDTFERYLRKVRKYYSRNVAGTAKPTPPSSRETTPSPLPSPVKSSPSPPRDPVSRPPAPQKLNIPDIFLEQNFDLSNPTTFTTVFPFLHESLNQSTRVNPFTIEPSEANQVESSGKLVQERLQHYIDQVEVCIAGQVASKSHHFFQVMTYHDALMSQLMALISVVRTLRERLSGVEAGVVQALRVPQMAMRQQNLAGLVTALSTIETLHKTQPTIQVLLTRQEFSGALDLIATSQDILSNEVVNIEALKHLPTQLNELMDIISKMLLTDFQEIIRKELEREVPKVTVSGDQESDCQVDECALSSIVTALTRQGSFTFLEFLEEQGVAAVKTTIKEVVLAVLDPTEETTLTSLVADFALQATPEGWSDLLDLLVGSLLVLLARLDTLHQAILQGLSNSTETEEGDILDSGGVGERVRSTAREVVINICDQVHERLGKLVTVRSRPQAIKLVTPEELARVQELISKLAGVTQDLCGKQSSGLQLSHQGQTILYIQHFHESCRTQVLSCLESEKWRRATCQTDSLADLHVAIGSDLGEVNGLVNGSNCDNGESGVMSEVIMLEGENFTFVESVTVFLKVLSEYCRLGDQLPLACVEVAMKTAELLKLFNSRSCQLVLGAGAVNLAGLKTITIRNLAVALRSLALVSKTVPGVKQHLLTVCPGLTDKQEITVSRNFDNATKDYKDHLAELDRKIVQIVDSALNQQLVGWERKPPVPSNTFKAIGKQLNKLLEAVQDILPPKEVTCLFRTIHLQFLARVGDKLREAKLSPDNSPTHGLVLSELIFYRENLKYMNILTPEDLSDSTLHVVWKR